ncbi:hypothetical protein D9613_004239 [Agrocybe pediades]|uniref:Copper homeostasis protein cutC homolog n=1 Tax=Agrocybe pediades TaxID=84607 RepID=A0A8H4QJS4_9AGAR|nr:hypothetical protein D9613_004239 [Agrocybe pediades]
MAALVTESLLLEVCVDSVQSAIAAAAGGADRLEVCSNLGAGGGTTPSLGLVKSIRKALRDISLMILIRPRVGDFVYTKQEVEVILEDIRMFKNIGSIRGFVVGALDREGRVGVECMKRIVDEILPLEVCFHRAFDMTRDAIEAFSTISDLGGVSRILTSGLKPKAPDGLPTLEKLFKTRKQLVEDDAWGLAIMPGSGINSSTISPLLKSLIPLGLREIHLSGGTWMPGQMVFRRPGMGMGVDEDPKKEWGVWCTNEEEIRKVRKLADDVWKEFLPTM